MSNPWIKRMKNAMEPDKAPEPRIDTCPKCGADSTSEQHWACGTFYKDKPAGYSSGIKLWGLIRTGECYERQLAQKDKRIAELEEAVKGDWYCTECEDYLCAERVTFEETCDTCGTEVLWVFAQPQGDTE